MENNEINNSELETMRAQIALLKDKLDKETIVSDKLLRDTMRHKARNINANAWISVAASIFVIFWALFYLPGEGFSWWFSGATILMGFLNILWIIKLFKRLERNADFPFSFFFTLE